MAILQQGMSLPTQRSSSDPPTPVEKSSSVDIPCDEKEATLDPDLDKSSSGFEDTVDEKPQYVNGEPVIINGRDVSRYLVDLRDDEDPPFTFRSAVLGTVIGGLGAALYQIYIFKPVQISTSTVFLLLLIYSLGTLWATFLPKRSRVEGTRFEWLGPALHFVNPGKFRLKEHVTASIIASSASWGSTSVLNFAVQRLFYDTKVRATTAILATFSTAVFGYGIVGILRPLTVYPSEMVYWLNLPMVSVFQGLHFNTAANTNEFDSFGLHSPLCSSTRSSRRIYSRSSMASASSVWLHNMHLPMCRTSSPTYLEIYEPSHYPAGKFLDRIYLLLYRDRGYLLLQHLEFKVLPDALHGTILLNGSIYHQTAVFSGPNFQLNQTALGQVGLPALTGSNAWSGLTSSLAIGALVAHCIFFWGPYVASSFKHAREKTQPDPHWIAMQKYKEVPWWWYIILLVLAFFAGLISVLHGETTLPVWSYIVALISGAIVTPFSTLLFARLGNGIATNQLFKMIAGAINPGRPVANLYFSMWSHDVVGTSIGLASDLKLGQYLKIPPRAMFVSQIWGTIIGCIVNYVVMVSITGSQREILLEPTGNSVWSGLQVQSLNSHAITWSLAKQLYGPSGPYFIIPLGIFIGFAVTFVHWLINKRWPYIGPVRVNSVILPIIIQYASFVTLLLPSTVISTILVVWRRSSGCAATIPDGTANTTISWAARLMAELNS
ncbi:OPT oligopeptide transporter protein-domain-containing protein [Russula aff. rugulosa BPL654]|nr:OPT oligopeptide transporter protein-domain-containing protein [Russula aff. rugulosa BPL654]